MQLRTLSGGGLSNGTRWCRALSNARSRSQVGVVRGQSAAACSHDQQRLTNSQMSGPPLDLTAPQGHNDDEQRAGGSEDSIDKPDHRRCVLTANRGGSAGHTQWRARELTPVRHRAGGAEGASLKQQTTERNCRAKSSEFGCLLRRPRLRPTPNGPECGLCDGSQPVRAALRRPTCT